MSLTFHFKVKPTRNEPVRLWAAMWVRNQVGVSTILTRSQRVREIVDGEMIFPSMNGNIVSAERRLLIVQKYGNGLGNRTP